MDNNGKLENSWSTKHRSRTLEDYCGDEIKNLVRNRFSKLENRPHCIYIKGPRGTGKTTIARIMSKYYHCENPKEDGTPCEECEMCQQINDILIAGDASIECPGVIEVDATTTNTKEKIQDIIDEAMIPPIYTSFKIIIFDECHMISKEAQNSLLKTIEDIPSHLVCIFCTTNDEKVLATIKSRMQVKILAKKQNLKQFVKRLEQISVMERLTISREALEVIVRKEDRIPRECINALENVAKTYNYKVDMDTIREYYGGDTSEIYVEFFKAATTSLADVMLVLKKIQERFPSYQEFVTGLYTFVIDSLYIKHGIDIDDYTTEYIKTIKAIFDIYTTNEFDMLLQIMEHLSLSMALDNDKKNEILLINTALRIGKVGILANGLTEEQHEMVEENKLSLEEHSKRVKKDNVEITEKLRMELNLTDLAENLGNVEKVNSSIKDIADIELKSNEFNFEPVNIDTSNKDKEKEDIYKYIDEISNLF